MNEFRGAFLGFRFNGHHSSEFGIVRTIDNRMDLNLRPESKDITMEVPGMDGSYYYGTNYTKRNFNIKFAFDRMTEKNLQDMKAWLMDKKIHELIFDEADYKAYSAKATGVSNVSHLCFEENGQRIYRGEGTIQFVCNYPFARSTDQDTIDTTNGYINTGDLPMPFKIKVARIQTLSGEKDDNGIDNNAKILEIKVDNSIVLKIGIHADKSTDGNGYAIIDTKDQMIYEYSSINKKLGILNYQIISGDFFELNPGEELSINDGTIEDLSDIGVTIEEFKYIYY